MAKSAKRSGARGREAGRRSQADRSAETRARILAAAVRCVDELGFARATFQRIARRAGVTVGAVQHHFAAKEDVLRAVLEDSFEHLSRCFDGVCVEGASLEERVSIFIDRAWLHCGYPPFRSTLEILMTTRGDDGGARTGRIPPCSRARGGSSGSGRRSSPRSRSPPRATSRCCASPLPPWPASR